MFVKVLSDSVRLYRQRFDGKLPPCGCHCVFKMDRFCVCSVIPNNGACCGGLELVTTVFL